MLRICVDLKKYVMMTVERIVLHGSVLGPFLFILYANYLFMNWSADKVCLHTDDMSLVTKEKVKESKSAKGKLIMQQAKKWFQFNKFKLEMNKI